jgi:hypothetical protein
MIEIIIVLGAVLFLSSLLLGCYAAEGVELDDK